MCGLYVCVVCVPTRWSTHLHLGVNESVLQAHTVELSGLPQAVVRRVRAGAQSLFSVRMCVCVCVCVYIYTCKDR